MPRPRILSSYGFKEQNIHVTSVPRIVPRRIAPIRHFEEPDCEIIKIDGNEEEEETTERRKDPVAIEVSREQSSDRVSSVEFVDSSTVKARQSYQGSRRNTVAPLSPSLPVQLITDLSTKCTTPAGNKYNQQNVVMVVPVNTVSPVIFASPTLCTLERIDNPNEISRVRRVMSIQQSGHGINDSQERSKEKIIPSKGENQRASVNKEVKDKVYFLNSQESSMSILKEPVDSNNYFSDQNCLISIMKNPICKVNYVSNQNSLFSVSKETFDIVGSFGTRSTFVRTPKIAGDKVARSSDRTFFSATTKPVEKIRRLAKKNNSVSATKESAEDMNLRYQKKSIFILQEAIAKMKMMEASACTAKESVEQVDSFGRPKNSISVLKDPINNNSSLATRKIAVSTITSYSTQTALNNDKLVTESDEPIQKMKKDSQEKKPVPSEIEICKDLENIRCIVCKKRFRDRYDLHKHASLEHRDVQTVFCEFCNESFLTERELKEHRFFSHDSKIANPVRISTEGKAAMPVKKDAMTNTKDILQPKAKTQKLQAGQKKRQKSLNQYLISSESLPGHSRSQKDRCRTRPMKKRVSVSNIKSKNWLKLRQSGTSQSGITKRRPLTKNRTILMKYNYVDEDVIRHTALASKNKFKSAEIKKLVVPLTRLEGPILDKYLNKFAKKPVITHDTNKVKKSEDLRRNRQKVESANQSKNIGNLRRGKRIKRPSKKTLMREEYERMTKSGKSTAKGREKNWTFKHETDSATDEMHSTEIMSSECRGSDDEVEEIIVDDVHSDHHQHDRGTKRKIDVTDPKDNTKSRDSCVNEIIQTDDDKCMTEIVDSGKHVEEENMKKRKSQEKKPKIQRDEVEIICTPANVESSKDVESAVDVNNSIEISTSGQFVRERRVIRKLTSRSSAASVVTLKLKQRKGESGYFSGKFTNESQSEREISDGADTESGYSSTKKSCVAVSPIRDEESSQKENSEMLKNNDDEDFLLQLESESEETLEINGKNVTATDENHANKQQIEIQSSQRTTPTTLNAPEKFKTSNKLSAVSQGGQRKSYSPSKRQPEIALKLKQQWDDGGSTSGKVHDLCLKCKELRSLMRKLATQFEEDKGTPVKCPFCNVWFNSMVYLDEHVAGNHLQCDNETPCKETSGLSKSSSNGDTNLNCETEKELDFECRHCMMKFDTEDSLDDHALAKHDTPMLIKRISSNDKPEYLDDLPSSCFKTVYAVNTFEVSLNVPPSDQSDDDDRSESLTNISRSWEEYSHEPTAVEEVISSRNTIEANEASTNFKDSSKHISTLDCALCESKFTNRAEYISHVRKTHNQLTLSPQITEKEKSTIPLNDNRAVSPSDSYMFDMDRPDDSETANQDVDEQIIADREYLLKQLLSDDSMDGFDEIEHLKIDKPVGEKATRCPEKKVIGLLSSLHTCKICYKEFKRTQDLLVHSLQHEHSAFGSGANFSEVGQTEMRSHHQELYYDPISDDCRPDLESIVPRSMISIEAECNAVDLPNRIVDQNPNSDESNQSHTDCEKRTSICIESSKKRLIGSKRLASKSSHPVSPKRSKPPGDVRNSKLRTPAKLKKSLCRKNKKSKPEIHPYNEKRDPVKELLETEEALENANMIDADVLNANDKIPIECSKCDRKFATQAALNEHLFFLHDDSLKDKVLTDVISPTTRDKGGKEPKKGWDCIGCHQSFKLLTRYKRHRYFLHGDESMIHVCENCSKILTSVTMVNVHICADVASYNCRPCNESFSTGMSLRLHNTEKHMEVEGPYLCEPCDKTFITKAMLDRHVGCNHRFVRPYKPRRSSPILMTTYEPATKRIQPEKRLNKDKENDVDTQSDEIELPENSSDQNSDMASEFDVKRSPVVNSRNRKKSLRATKIVASWRKKPLRLPMEDEAANYHIPNKAKVRALQEDSSVAGAKKSITYIDEDQIYQCSICHLYCLTNKALRNHLARNHPTTADVCQLCHKMYSKGKLVRHMIDHHIYPTEGYTFKNDSIWDNGKDGNEKDTETFIKMLGIKRFFSLCEYQRYPDLTNGDLICPSCNATFASSDLYRYHFLLNHDVMCALCDIEFTSGKEAGKHKNQVHGAIGCYIWFAVKTVTAVTATRNFAHVADENFIEMISRKTDESSNIKLTKGDENIVDEILSGNSSCNEFLKTKLDDRDTLSENFSDSNDEKLIVVVTNEDLEKYNIGTRYPNIWGLAAKISSTSHILTPKDVKEMLETHFERADGRQT